MIISAFAMPYDPRNPPTEAMVHNGSTHPFHAKLRKTLVLLKFADAYFVVEGLGDVDDSLAEVKTHAEYYYNEHTCPTNFARCFEAIVHKGDFDPHGVFQFVDVVWMTCDYEGRDDNAKELWLKKAFPQLEDQ